MSKLRIWWFQHGSLEGVSYVVVQSISEGKRLLEAVVAKDTFCDVVGGLQKYDGIKNEWKDLDITII